MFEIGTALGRLAFKERSASDEDLRAMFSACNEARFSIQKDRGKIENQAVAALLETLDRDFAQIRRLSLWSPNETGLKSDRQPEAADMDHLEQWASQEGKAIVDRLKPLYINPHPKTMLFFEIREIQQRIVGIVEAAKRLAEPRVRM